MPPSASASKALDALEECLKGVLMHTGAALNNAAQGKSLVLDATRSQIEYVLPDFLKRWHLPLNDLESELAHASVALHRDLELSRRQIANNIASKTERTSPAASLDSDIVMVEAPTIDTDEKEVEDKMETGGAELDLFEEILQSRAQPDINPATNPASEESKSLQLPASDSVLSGKQTLMTVSHVDQGLSQAIIKSQTHSPGPTFEHSQQFSNFDDASSALSNADVRSLLPIVMDYANDTNNGVGDSSNMADSANSSFAQPSALAQPEASSNMQPTLDNPDDNHFLDSGFMTFDTTFDWGTGTDTGANEGPAGGSSAALEFDENLFSLDDDNTTTNA